MNETLWGRTVSCAPIANRRNVRLFALFAASIVAVPAQTFTTLHSFDNADGANPFTGLLQGTDGNLYGTTVYGGADAFGTVFKITPSGALTTMHNFCSVSDCTDGSEPFAGLALATNGDLYGTTGHGGLDGTYGFGTAFKITPSGTLTTLHDFCSLDCLDGESPNGLIRATNGVFYGTTYSGGAHLGNGTVFKITPSGSLSTVYSFCAQSGCTDGAGPLAGVLQATNGDFYGVTDGGGAYGLGTVFKITSSGVLTTLHSFCSPDDSCADGQHPQAGLIQAGDGELYGTTYEGGAAAAGTVFKITPGGTLITIYTFCPTFRCTDGAFPAAGLVQGTDRNLYGTTQTGGDGDGGTIFKITPGGTLTTLYSFCSQSACSDGETPNAGLVQATNGTFYGTTSDGGANGNYGTVFSLSVGLGPFVETLPTSGKAGSIVQVLGTDLTGATSLTFNGTAAAFKIVSASEIATKVPDGATTGIVQVVTRSGKLSSNVPYQVRQ
jgi:uncharacterized repeat protein (TIGR03803 family)